MLVIQFTDGKSTYSKDDMKRGVIFNYDQNNCLVSIEILDLYEIFADV